MCAGGKSLPFWSRQQPRGPTPKFGIYPPVQHFGFLGVRTQMAHWHFCLKIWLQKYQCRGSFTAELELHRELLNNLDGAIAIFSISGELYHQNEAHAHLWDGLSTDPENRSTIQDASKLWQSRSKPTGLWGERRDFINQIDEREGWREDIIYENEQRISVQIVPLMGQHTTVCFTY